MKRRKVVFAHYNPDSSGSFVRKTIAQIELVSKTYEVILHVPENGEFVKTVSEQCDVSIHFCGFHERTTYVNYLFHILSYAWFLIRHKVSLVYFLDWVWWRPAEALAASLLRVPTLGFCGFYKTKEELDGGLSGLTHLVANSEATAVAFTEYERPITYSVVHNFIDLKAFDNAIATSGPPKLKGTRFGFVGSLIPIKGIEYAIEALSNLALYADGFEFVIVGDARDSEYRLEIEQLISTSNISDRTYMMGHRDDVYSLMKSIDVLIVPSLDEPFGYINIEAGAAGVPVIASDVGGIPEIVIDNVTGYLVEPRDSQKIESLCYRLLTNLELRQNLGSNARKRVESRFSKAVVVGEWLKIIDNLVETHPA